MKIEFGNFEFTECWDGVLYKKLSVYPEMTDWEIQTVLDFIKYEKDNGRECELVGDENILAKVRAAFAVDKDFTYFHYPIVEGMLPPNSIEAVPISYMEIAHAE